MSDPKEIIREEIIRQFKVRKKVTLSEIVGYADESLTRNGLGPIPNQQSIVDTIIWDLIIKRAITPLSPERFKEMDKFVTQSLFVSDESKLN